MFGPIELAAYPLLATSLLAAVTDVMYGRIYNWLTGASILGALIYAGVVSGWAGLGGALAGAATGLLLYGWMFWLGHMGGGDVKLVMALGAWVGPLVAFDIVVVSLLLGGILSIALLLVRGKLRGTLRKIWRFIFTAGMPKLEVELPKMDKSDTMPYGVPIALATVWVVYANPMVLWGLRPW